MDPSSLYHAEVEFITSEEWIRELQVLFTDLLDTAGNVSHDCTNTDSDAGVAYAKLTAVYPQKTRDMLGKCDYQNLANEPNVRHILGSTKTLRATSSLDMYRSLQCYVNSQEKDRMKKDRPTEYWPLIKVVRIFTKAKALSTGACIVDLVSVGPSLDYNYSAADTTI